MGLIYLVQVFRFGIFRYNGCQSMLSPTWLTTVLYTVWMLVWSMIGFIYASLLLIVFYKKRKDVKDILHCTNSGLNISRFARLLIFCMVIILIMFPFSIYSFVSDLSSASPTYRHYSFGETHNKALWSVILHFDPGVPLYSVWLYILMSYLVFLIFGLGSDALRMYSNFTRTIGLRCVLDTIEDWRVKNQDTRIGKITNKFLPGDQHNCDSYAQFNCGTSTDGIVTVSDYTEKTVSPSSLSQFEIDYTLPYEREGREKNSDNRLILDPKLSTFFHSVSDDSDDSSEIRGSHSASDDTNEFEYHYRLDHHYK